MTIIGYTWVDARAGGNEVVGLIDGEVCFREQSVITIDAWESVYSGPFPSAEAPASCHVPGALISFTIDGRPADESGMFWPATTSRIDLVAGPPFSYYTGIIDFEDWISDMRIEPYIDGKRCGFQLNMFQGEGPKTSYVVLVEPDEIKPGCGREGAHVILTLVAGERSADIDDIRVDLITAASAPGRETKLPQVLVPVERGTDPPR